MIAFGLRGLCSGAFTLLGIFYHGDMKKNATFGTAIWITKDGKTMRSENHLEDLVSKSFDMDLFKSKFMEFVRDNFVTEANIAEMEEEGPPFNPNEPGAPQLMTDKQLAEFMYIQELEPIQIGEIPALANNLEQAGAENAAEYLLRLVPEVSAPGFEKVVFGKEQPYHFAFKRGDIRIRLFTNSEFVVEMSASRMNRDSAGRIIDSLLSLTGGNPKRVASITLDLIDFTGKEPSTQTHKYRTMDEFFEGLSELTLRRVAYPIDLLLKLATIFYQRVKERL